MPESPYAAAKAFGHHITQVYRKSHKMFAVVGILYNHESPLRGYEFVSRKITRGLAKIKYGLENYVMLGNINAKRDWGHARDYCKAMHAMLQADQPRDYVVATGETHSVQEFIEKSCTFFGLDPTKVLKIDPSLLRPNDVKILIGDAFLARKYLRWQAETSFDQLITEMCNYDLHDLSPDPIIRAKTETLL
jgi:GDPmannose 4,6-dehydratase